HLTDDQGWRIALPSYPELTTTGASSSTGGQSTWGAFTREQWLELDAYAQKRHVVLVPEIDLPGHTHAVKSTYSWLGCGEDKGWPYTGVEVGFNNICNSDAGKSFIATVLDEVSDMTSGPYVHIGGDECQSMSSGDYSALVRHAESTVNAKGKIAVGWSEAANGSQSSSTILQKWKADGGAPGANWINSTCAYAYIDHPEGESTDGNYQWSTWCTHGGAVGAQSVYGMEAGTAGVEAALWSEYNYSAEIAEAKLFPRIVALAENGWTPAAKRNWWTYSSNLTALGESFFRNVPAPAESDPIAGIERAPVHTLASARPVEHVIFAVTGRRIAAMAAEEGVDVADQMRNGVFAPGTYVVRTRWSDGSASGKRIVLR
ncbi:MAG: family 20 glycosylhydrolase, partial [Fibrobacterales bacterium]|nr:family 20 glycosylhydrolase [Fibrobacterales bacterium]